MNPTSSATKPRQRKRDRVQNLFSKLGIGSRPDSPTPSISQSGSSSARDLNLDVRGRQGEISVPTEDPPQSTTVAQSTDGDRPITEDALSVGGKEIQPTDIASIGDRAHTRPQSSADTTIAPTTRTNAADTPVMSSADGDVTTPGIATDEGSVPSTARTIFYGTKEVLRVIKETTDVFPLVKSVAAAMLEILNMFDTVEDNRDEVKKLLIQDRLGGLARMLEQKVSEMKRKLDDSKVKRVFNATEDEKEIQRAVEEVRFAIEIAMLDVSISGHRVTVQVAEGMGWVKEKVVETRDMVAGAKEVVEWLKKNEYLKRIKTVTGAEFKQGDRQGCIPGTRVALLASLLRWAKDPTSPSIFWLCGMAGTGKTTVSETFCTQLRVEGLLGASFFCSLDDAARRDVRRIIPSLARSLARARPKFAEQLVKTLESDEYPDDPIAMNLEDQYRVLILDPVRQAFDADMPLTLSIDALDECPKDAIKLLLKAILSQSSPPSLKVFLTSRPEDHLEDRFTSYDKHRQLLLHDVEQHIVQADIAVYPRHALLQISDLEGHVQFSLSLTHCAQLTLLDSSMPMNQTVLCAAASPWK
ncbi:hypothetical protein CC1G_03116 [Coprinopsis cinerea okayama7|uniref:Nephrocystin 3-like N-terminal domain-containing protein n=1 Tax=Coprinopsis cinerea (strain Okayama-7 / 130 / ATCC MYA-4618 / FGSC 9003) TaxID=240176 RepID=A8PF00_COPC7|nr:hypothetical protein CC1G_03116 [Coprinopsis cinerea okayama7\|eukprot:XP_001840887.1 hypothetical protein CC1G_03116 [Coprinopsis cinerea okayama7\